jgi:hypothetical protein
MALNQSLSIVSSFLPVTAVSCAQLHVFERHFNCQRSAGSLHFKAKCCCRSAALASLHIRLVQGWYHPALLLFTVEKTTQKGVIIRVLLWLLLGEFAKVADFCVLTSKDGSC